MKYKLQNSYKNIWTHFRIRIFETSWIANNRMWNINYRIVIKIFGYYFESEHLGVLGLSIIECKM
jgi:hypothetical protein